MGGEHVQSALAGVRRLEDSAVTWALQVVDLPEATQRYAKDRRRVETRRPGELESFHQASRA